MDITKQQNCENCKFYLQHYIKKTTGFAKVSFGHCTYPRIINHSQKRKDCKYWQPTETNDTISKQQLTAYLKSLARRLEAVCEVILDEENV